MNLCLDQLTHCYGDMTALKNVSCEVPCDSFVTIVGPTNAGKTTLLRLLVGDEVPMTGTVRFMSSDTESPTKLETVSTVFLGAASSTETDNLSSFEADVVLVDQWSDSVSRTPKERREYLRNLRAHSGGLIIYATRDEADALALSDQLIVMRGGSLHQVGGHRNDDGVRDRDRATGRRRFADVRDRAHHDPRAGLVYQRVEHAVDFDR